MTTKIPEIRPLILLDLDKFKFLKEKSKKLTDLQRQQIPETPDRDKAKMNDTNERLVAEQKTENEKVADLSKTINIAGGGGPEKNEQIKEEDEKEKTIQQFDVLSWFKIL